MAATGKPAALARVPPCASRKQVAMIENTCLAEPLHPRRDNADEEPPNKEEMVTGLLLFALMDNPLISQLTSATYLRVACQRTPIGNQINLRNGSTNCRFGVDSRSDLSLRSY